MIAEKVYDLLPSSWPLTIGDLPSTNKNAVGIMEYDGYTSTEFFGAKDSSSILEPIIKVVIRNDSYAEGQSWANTAKEILHRHHDEDILSMFIVGSPIYLGRNEQKLHEFQVTFKTKTKE